MFLKFYHLVFQAMLMLKHKNIVTLEEVLETEDSVYFVMELCGGGSLNNYVAVEVDNNSIFLFE